MRIVRSVFGRGHPSAILGDFRARSQPGNHLTHQHRIASAQLEPIFGVSPRNVFDRALRISGKLQKAIEGEAADRRTGGLRYQTFCPYPLFS
jgi:hypothetical protein